MRRLQLGLLGIGLPLLVVCLALSGCKRVEEPENSNLWEDLQGNSKRGTAVEKTGIPMGKGAIKGRVVWKGAKPNIPKLDAEMLTQLGSKDSTVCLSPECSMDEKDQQVYRIGANDGVGHVVIYLTRTNKNSYFKFSEEDIQSLKLEELKMRQPHCAFIPHVARAFTHYTDPDNPKKLKETGQKVTVINDATITHNTQWSDTGKIRGGNLGLPPGSSLLLPMVPETRPLRIQCSIHAWMDAFIWDFDHPYVAISECDGMKADDKDYGTYVIKNVPTGVKLKVNAWHEDGLVTGGGEIELKEGETLSDKNFEISKK